MNKKGRVVITLVLGVAVLAAFTLAYAKAKVKAPDKPLTIDTKDVYAKKKKTPVVFAHTKHKAQKCQKCHHTWKEGEKVKNCGECHKDKKDKKDKKKLGLKKAFHDQCIKCHKALKKEKKKTGPTGCVKCHPKKKKK